MFNAASPIKSRTAAVTADGLYQEDVAVALVVEPAVQPDVPKQEEASTQALSSARLHLFHFWMQKMQHFLTKSKSYVELVSGELLRSRRIHITYIYG